LLLISLTEINADIQKIVAFGNTFERLLAIIEEEEGISGGIIVQDSLSLTYNLLRYNVSNQVHLIGQLRESVYTVQLTQWYI
jgi:hypothetical protein